GLQHLFTIDSPGGISPAGPLANALQIYETRTEQSIQISIAPLRESAGPFLVVARFLQGLFDLMVLRVRNGNSIRVRNAARHSSKNDGMPCPEGLFKEPGTRRIRNVQVEVSDQNVRF